MESSRLTNAGSLNLEDEVGAWQSERHTNATVEYESGILGSLFDALTRFLQTALQEINKGDITLPSYDSVEKSAATLLFWGNDHGVSKGELDRLLHHSMFLRDTVLSVLISISELLSQSLIHLIPTKATRSRLLKSSRISTLIEGARYALEVSEEQEDDNNQTTLDKEQICLTLQRRIECLVALNPSLECPAESESDEEEEVRAGLIIQDRPAHRYFADLIAIKFPAANPKLVQTLGLCNWSRYKHVKQEKDNVQANTEVDHSGEKARSEFHDSGLGSAPSISLPQNVRAQSVYAETVVSSRAEASHKRLPPLPKEGRDGKLFTCEICNRKISIRRTKDWRKHVFKDICAYTCLFPRCSMGDVLFDDCETMTGHVKSQHCERQGILSTICPLCSESVEGPVEVAVIHLTRHMEDIALGILPRGEDLEYDSDVSDQSDEPDSDAFKLQPGNLDIEGESSQEFLEKSPQKAKAFDPTPMPHPGLAHDPPPRDVHSSLQPKEGEQPSLPDLTPMLQSQSLDRLSAGSNDSSSPLIDLPCITITHDESGSQSTTSTKPDVYTLNSIFPQEPNVSVGPLSDYIDTQRTKKHPATFQCTLCPKRFTRAYNLRSHLRTHTDERPFVCSVCGKGFARQHDRKRHEALHTSEKKFVCRGNLKDNTHWGCSRRFARADALGRHFRSEAGRVCIQPLLDEELQERVALQGKVAFVKDASQLQTPPQPEDPSFELPAVLYAQYPALATTSFDVTPWFMEDDDDVSTGRPYLDTTSSGYNFGDSRDDQQIEDPEDGGVAAHVTN